MSILLIFLASLLVIFITIQLLYQLATATKNQRVEYYTRCLASLISLILCAAYGTIASACLNLAGYGGLGQWTAARAFKWTMYLMTGMWFDIEDPEDWLGKTRPAVFVGNHQTELDVLFLGHMFPRYCSVTAKKSLKYWPILGWFMGLSKTVFIERASRTQAMAAFDKAAEQMHSNRQSVYIFPEGTRSYHDKPDLLPFKKGAFHLAIQAQVPIVPVVTANYSNVLDVRRQRFKPGTIPARVLRPIETKGMSNTSEEVGALMDKTRNLMLEALKEITVHAREQGVAMKEHEARKVDGQAKSTGIDMGLTG